MKNTYRFLSSKRTSAFLKRLVSLSRCSLERRRTVRILMRTIISLKSLPRRMPLTEMIWLAEKTNTSYTTKAFEEFYSVTFLARLSPN